MTAWHSVFWSPSKHRWLVRVGQDGRSQRQLTVPVDVACGPRAKKAAEKWSNEQLEAKAIEKEAPPAPKTLAELAPIALALWAADDRIAPKTRYDRESFVRRNILPEFGDKPIEAIDVPLVRAWVRAMRKNGDARSSIGNRLSALSTLLSDLHAEGKGPDNRVATAKAVLDELPAQKKRAPVALPPSALEMLLNDTETPAWFALLAALAGLAGLEAGACWIASTILRRVLEFNGYRAGVVYDVINAHAFVVTECGKTLDATMGQFSAQYGFPAEIHVGTDVLPHDVGVVPRALLHHTDGCIQGPSWPGFFRELIGRVLRRMGVEGVEA